MTEMLHTDELRPHVGEWDIYVVVGTELPSTNTETAERTESFEPPLGAIDPVYQESQTEGSTTCVLGLTRAGGDALESSNIYIGGEGITSVGGATPDLSSPETRWGTATGLEKIFAGNRVITGVRNGFEINMIWRSGDQSQVLAEASGQAA